MRLVALSVALVLATAASLPAQEVTGRIEGRVLGPDSTGLAEAQVTVSSPSLLGIRSAISDRGGRFRVLALPVGTYQVAVRRIGFGPVTVEDVPVRLGETASLPRITLSAAPLQLEEIRVTAAAAGLERTITAASTVLQAGQLDVLPLARNFRDILILAPTAIPSYRGDGPNIGGATGIENTYYVDGINITSPLFGDGSLDLPYNFIQQIQLSTGGSSADEAQALGGVINVVTPSGGNRFSGKVFGFFSSDGLQTSARQVVGATQTGYNFYDAGAVVSGPILRDKLWFFAAYNPAYERRVHTFGFGQIAAVSRVQQFAVKLNAAIGPNTSTMLTVLGSPTRSEGIGYPVFSLPGAIPQNAEALQLTGRRGGVGVSVRARHGLSSKVLLETAISQMTFIQSDEPASEAGRAPSFSDAEAGTLSGGNGGTIRLDSRRRAASADVSWRVGTHSLKAGAQYEVLRASNHGEIFSITRASASQYDAFIATVDKDGRAENRIPTMYMQDSWTFSPRLSLMAGVRYQHQDIWNAVADTFAFRVHNGLLPRLGVTIQLDGRGSHRLFASYGRVADQVLLWGPPQGFGVNTARGVSYPQDPRVDTTGGVTGFLFGCSGDCVPSDENLRGATSDEWSAGYSGRVGKRLLITLRGTRRSLKDALESSYNGGKGLIWGNPGRGAMTDFPRARRTYQALQAVLASTEGASTWFQLSYVLSRTRGNVPGNFQSDYGLAAPQWGPFWDFPSALVNATGLLPQDRTHVFKAFGSHQFGFGLALGLNLVVASGTPLSEYGVIPEGPPYLGFASPRGTAGRTPMIWDVGLRAAYELPSFSRSVERSRVLLDLEHFGSPRSAVDYDQQRFTCLVSGLQGCPSASYGRATKYQPPMTARIGLEVSF